MAKITPTIIATTTAKHFELFKTTDEKSNAAITRFNFSLISHYGWMLRSSVVCIFNPNWVASFNKIMKTRECDEMSVEHIEELDT